MNMKRLATMVLIAAGVTVLMRKMARMGDPEMREKCSDMCDRMLDQMPDSFPLKRMMADLESVKEQTARILELLEDQTES